MRFFFKTYYFFVTLFLPIAGILLAKKTEIEKVFLLKQCSRFCHDKGCLHGSLLPDFLAGNTGLFGNTIEFLRKAGFALEELGLPLGTGYGAANLIIFCLIPPVLHLIMFFLTRRLLK